MTASTLPTVSKLPATPHLSLALLPDLAASLALSGLVGTTVKKKRHVHRSGGSSSLKCRFKL